MRTAVKVVTVLSGQTYQQYVTGLAPALWYRLNEPSGVTSINGGALGATDNGVFTPGTGAVAQAGKLGPASAYLFDGANSKITVPAGAYANYTKISIGALVNPSTLGESSSGRIFQFGDLNGAFRVRLITAFAIQAGREATGAASTTTSTTLTQNAWQWVFMTLDWTGDKTIHLYLGKNGAAPEMTYAAPPTAGSGALGDDSALPLVIGNDSTQARSYAGLIDEFLLANAIWTPAQMTKIVQLSGA